MVKQKHFRLPEDVLAMINNRDKEMYPTENVYITEAVRNFFKKEETENVMDELEDIQDKLDRIEKKLEEDASKKNISFSRTLWKTRFPKINSKGWMRWIG